MSKRPLQLASIIHRAVQSVLSGGLADPRLDAMISITAVEVSPDLRSATLHVSILPEKAESKAIHALRDASKHIRREAAERIKIQRMPDLLFKIDKTIKRQAELHAALGRVESERDDDMPPPDLHADQNHNPDGERT